MKCVLDVFARVYACVHVCAQLSILPFWITAWLMNDDSAASVAINGSTSAGAHMGFVINRNVAGSPKVLRIVRLLRLLKFSRILKASDLFTRMETQLEVPVTC